MLLRLMLLCGFIAPMSATAIQGDDPSPPFRIVDNVYYVGSRDMASLLITTPAGHILIDGGFESTVPIIRANMGSLGFKLEDVKILLNTQAHFDHAAGFAALKRLTGAQLMVSAPDADLIERGGRGDFLFGDAHPYPPATVDRRLHDGDLVRLGGVVLTGHVTGGHTRGCTTWTWRATDRGRSVQVVDVGGVSVLDGMRLAGMKTYPTIGRDFERTFAVLKALRVDVFLGAHASYFDGQAKAARMRANPDGSNPFIDPAGYRLFVRRAEHQFLDTRKAQADSRRDPPRSALSYSSSRESRN